MPRALNSLQLGQYTIGERLGVGGMAEVFDATSRQFGRVALKRILPGLARDREFEDMFWDEARVTSRLDHPNIMRLLDYGSVDGELYMALEFVDGPSVARLLRKAASLRTRLDVGGVVSLGLQLLDALQCVHSARDDAGRDLGIVHRDISPGNVMLTTTGQVKLGDFGIVRSEVVARRTQPGELKGKVGYMSPEQAVGAQLDPRSDIFSVGIILAELLILRPLLLGRNELQTLKRTSEADLTTWHRFNGHVPVALRSVVERALRRGRDERYGSAGEMRMALRAAAEAAGCDVHGERVHDLLISTGLAGDEQVGKTVSGERMIQHPVASTVPVPAEDLRMVQPLGRAPRAAGKPVWTVEFTEESLPAHLMLALRRAHDGLIELSTPERAATLELRSGRIVAVVDSTGIAPLGRLLLDAGVVERSGLVSAIGESKRSGLRLGEFLVLQRKLRESTLLRYLREQSNQRLEPWFHGQAGKLSVFVAEGNRLADELDVAPEGVAQVVGAMRLALAQEAVHQRLESVLDAIVLPAASHRDPAELGLSAPEARVLSTTLPGGVFEGRSIRYVIDTLSDERVARRKEAGFAILVGLCAGVIQAPGFGV